MFLSKLKVLTEPVGSPVFLEFGVNVKTGMYFLVPFLCVDLYVSVNI
jgi:hypothetical protein